MGMPPQNTFDREKISLNIVRLKKGGKDFEVVLDNPELALRLRKGEPGIELRDVLKSPQIFSDAKKGEGKAEVASKSEFLALFGTDNETEIIKKIIQEGEFHLTADQKRDLVEKKRIAIIDYIHMNAMDPKTGFPHPKQRIELAMEQAKIHLNMYESITSQTEEVVKALKPIIPISFEKIRLQITIPVSYSGKVYSAIKSNYEVTNEAWKNDGSVMVEVSLQAGKRDAIFDMVNKLTKGEATIEEVKK